MKLTISHITRYAFDAAVPFGLQQVRLVPQSAFGQTVLDWQVAVDGGTVEAAYRDEWGSEVRLVGFAPEITAFEVRSAGTVETPEDTAGVLGPHKGPVPLWLFQQRTPLTRPGSGIATLINGLDGGPTLDTLHALSDRIRQAVAYDTDGTHPGTTAEEALKLGKGVCQDHTHIFLSAARALGAPARYVSGYLMMNDRVDQDATHAWAEAHVDGLGWVGFDVSNGISPDGRYVRVAAAPDYAAAAPIVGMRYGDAAEELAVALQVQQ